MLSESFPTAVFPPVSACAVPEFETVAPWLMITMPPRLPPAVPVAIWSTPVLDTLPFALASPVLISAVPSEELLVSAVLLEMDPPALECWVEPAVLSELFPVALLSPVVAVAEPEFVTSAFWSMIRMPPRDPAPPAEASTDWLMFVVASFPVAVASPVLMLAVPSEEFDVPAVLFDTPESEPDPVADDDCVPCALLSDPLPVAVLPPVVAVAVPWFVTVAF